MKSSARQRSDRAFDAIEGLLSSMHPRQDVRALTDGLRESYASADALFAVSAHMLERAGLHAHDALLLSRLPELNRHMALSRFGEHPRLNRLALASDYLIANFHGLRVERFYMLCLDVRGRLMERVFLQEGTLDGALFSLKHVLSELMRVHPAAALISHNHPGNTLRPSQEDIDCTLDLLRALDAVGIPLLDHIIVAGQSAVSMRENGFVPTALWARQQPQSALLRNWLCPVEEGSPAKPPKRGNPEEK